MKVLSLLSLLLAFSACTSEDEAGGMAGGGSANAINQNEGGSDNPSGDDTGSYGNPPTITSADALWDENAEGDWQILVSVSYEDVDDDMDGGKVGVSAEISGVASPEQWFMIDGNEAIHDSEARIIDMTLLLDQVEIDPAAGDVKLMLRLKDAALNASETYEITPG
jgi:hypothetical protein